MFDCSDDVLAYHDDEVTLPQADRSVMRGRRDANRDRLKKGLKDKKKPAPREFVSQGSYAVKTMTQHPKRDYDIDDGAYCAEKHKLRVQASGEIDEVVSLVTNLGVQRGLILDSSFLNDLGEQRSKLILKLLDLLVPGRLVWISLCHVNFLCFAIL